MKRFVRIAGFCVVTPLLQLGCLYGSEWSNGVAVGWDSLYVSEGRDNLEDGGLVYGEVALTNGVWEFGALAAEGDSVDYKEQNYWIARSDRFGHFDTSVSFGYLMFDEDPSDRELSAEVGTDLLGDLYVSFGATYSLEAEGAFYELVLSRDIVVGERCLLVPYGSVSSNEGYVSGEPEGWNHAAFGFALEFQATEAVEAAFFGNVSIGIADGVDDVGWCGVRLSF